MQYLQHVLITLPQIEDRLFRVSTRWLKTNSLRLRRLWNTPPGSEVDREEAEPTLVPEVTVAQFEALLGYIDERLGSCRKGYRSQY